MPRKQISLQLSDMTQEKIAALAEYWGFPPVRHNTPVIAEAIDRIYRETFRDSPPGSREQIIKTVAKKIGMRE